MSPEAEAHKMIAISLGKIANSRIQRGGPKLFKNLLVANLIQKARVLMVEEPQTQETARFECPNEGYECETSESEIDVGSEQPNEFADDISVKPSFTTNDSTPKLSLGEESATQQGYCDTQPQEGKHLMFKSGEWDENNKENRPTNQEDSNTSVSFKLDIGLTNAAESPRLHSDSVNVSQIPLESINNTSEQECTKYNVPLRCLKRRNETSAENETSSFNQKRYRSADLLNTKRWRRAPILDNQLGLSDVESDFEGESPEFKYPSKVNILLSVELHCESELGNSNLSTEYTPMESEQMSSLASVFSSSFHGLGVRPINDHNKSISFDLCTSDGTYHVDSTGLSKSNSNSDMVVCSKQAASVLKVSFPGNKPVAVLV